MGLQVRWPLRARLVANLVVFVLARSLSAQCDPAWQSTGVLPTTNWEVRAALEWHRGVGEDATSVLIAGGDFLRAGGVPANCIAQFDGQTWQPLGAGFNDRVNALLLFDFDGTGPQLVAGGHFQSSGGVATGGVARWDGSTWQAMGSLSPIVALTIWDPDGDGPLAPRLVAGGWSPANVKWWDGSRWQQVGSGSGGPVGVVALTTWDPDGDGPIPPYLVTGDPSYRVRVWNGVQWLSLEPGGASFGAALTSWDPDGSGPLPPQLIGGGSQGRVRRWDGTMWQPIGNSPLAGIVLALTSWDPDGDGPQPPQLVAGRQWGNSTPVASWDGAQWNSFPTGAVDLVYALTPWATDARVPQKKDLVVAGNFTARWDGGRWRPLGSGLRTLVNCQTLWDPDGNGPLPKHLVVGSGTYLQQWDGAHWQQIGATAFRGTIYSVITAESDGNPLGPRQLIVGGGAYYASGDEPRAGRVASWAHSRWEPLGLGMDSPVRALTNWDPDGDGPRPSLIVAAGDFTTADGAPANRIAVWNGANWAPLGSGLNGTVRSLTTWDPDGPGPLPPFLVVAGSFSKAGDVVVNGIARWDGTAWHEFAPAQSSVISAVCTWDPDGDGPMTERLAAMDWFRRDDGSLFSAVGIWDQDRWQLIELPTVSYNSYLQLTAWDPDGSGPAPPTLVVAGSSCCSLYPTWVFRLDGHQWIPIGDQINDSVSSIGTWDPDGPGIRPARLVIAGNFTAAGGVPSSYVALASCPELTCPADIDGDGRLGASDIGYFLSIWQASLTHGTLDGDYDNDLVVNPADVSAFVRAWLVSLSTGC